MDRNPFFQYDESSKETPAKYAYFPMSKPIYQNSLELASMLNLSQNNASSSSPNPSSPYLSSSNVSSSNLSSPNICSPYLSSSNISRSNSVTLLSTQPDWQMVVSSPTKKAKKDCIPYTTYDDINLTKSYLIVSEDAVHGRDQKGDVYWRGVQGYYNANLEGRPSRTHCSLKNRWIRFISKALQNMGTIIRRENNNRGSGYTEQDCSKRALDEWERVAKRKWTYQECWELVKNNPKWAPYPDDYPTGTSHGAKKKKGKGVMSSEPITDLCDDDLSPPEANPYDERPIGNKEALKLKRRKAKGVVTCEEGIQGLLSRVEQIDKERNESMTLKKESRERKIRASTAQELFFSQAARLDAERRQEEILRREDDILYKSLDGLDQESKDELIERKKEIREIRARRKRMTMGMS